MDPVSDRLLNLSQAAERLGISPHTARLWCKQGRLPHVRLSSRTIRFEPSRIEQIIDEGRREDSKS